MRNRVSSARFASRPAAPHGPVAGPAVVGSGARFRPRAGTAGVRFRRSEPRQQTIELNGAHDHQKHDARTEENPEIVEHGRFPSSLVTPQHAIRRCGAGIQGLPIRRHVLCCRRQCRTTAGRPFNPAVASFAALRDRLDNPATPRCSSRRRGSGRSQNPPRDSIQFLRQDFGPHPRRRDDRIIQRPVAALRAKRPRRAKRRRQRPDQ